MQETGTPTNVGSNAGLGEHQPPKRVDFDMRTPRWGHAIYFDGENSDGSWRVSGCLTPLPLTGQTVKLKGGFILRFREVFPMGNPNDGFFGVMEATGWMANEESPNA